MQDEEKTKVYISELGGYNFIKFTREEIAILMSAGYVRRIAAFPELGEVFYFHKDETREYDLKKIISNIRELIKIYKDPPEEIIKLIDHLRWLRNDTQKDFNKENTSERELLSKWLIIGSILHNGLEEAKKDFPYPLLTQVMLDTSNYLNKDLENAE